MATGLVMAHYGAGVDSAGLQQGSIRHCLLAPGRRLLVFSQGNCRVSDAVPSSNHARHLRVSATADKRPDLAPS